MFATLIPNLITLIVTVRKNVFASVMTVLFILSIIFAWSARGHIATWLEQNPSAEQKTERITRGLDSDRKISVAIKKDLDALNGDRVFIRQFHDVKDPEVNRSIPSMSVTYFVHAPGVSFPTDRLTVPRAYLTDMISTVWDGTNTPKCSVLFINEIRDVVYKEQLLNAGVAIFYSCPIIGIDGAPLGTIHVSYLTTTKRRPSDEVIYARLSSTANKIAGYLAEVTAPERDTWYRKVLNW